LPARVQLEFDGRYAAMLSHEPKNYALRTYSGALLLRGVAFRSSRSEPFGEVFLRRAITALLAHDVPAVRAAYLDVVDALRTRSLPTADVAARVRLTKTPAEYLATRAQRRELPYEAMLNSGRDSWTARERIRVYRAQGNRAALFSESTADPDDDSLANKRDARDYDVDFYLRQLRETFAARLARAFKAEDFAVLFADPQQLNLFPPDLAAIEPILTRLPHRLDATASEDAAPDSSLRDPFE
jgi:DNA polymerase elongation subunit (family B)